MLPAAEGRLYVLEKETKSGNFRGRPQQFRYDQHTPEKFVHADENNKEAIPQRNPFVNGLSIVARRHDTDGARHSFYGTPYSGSSIPRLQPDSDEIYLPHT